MGNRKKPGLNAKQRRFVEEYLVDLNATQAALRAGYSKKTAGSQGNRLLKNAEIRAAIKNGQDARADRTEVTQDVVLKELFQLLTSDVMNYEFGSVGEPLTPTDGAPDDVMRAVASIKRTVRRENDDSSLENVEFRLWDKTKAISLAMRHLGMFNDKVTVGIDEEVKNQIRDAAESLTSRILGIASRKAAG